MARQAYYFGQLTDEILNGRKSYRVQFSYGTFSVSAKVTQRGGCYHYAIKRHKGKLFKVYVGTAGEITKERLHQATMELSHKCYSETGDWYTRTNRGREPR
jgi:hypothetical protein